eukprot:scaffold2404_cov398-Prasinococcus_capsulatus_cf.AAC.7
MALLEVCRWRQRKLRRPSGWVLVPRGRWAIVQVALARDKTQSTHSPATYLSDSANVDHRQLVQHSERSSLADGV